MLFASFYGCETEQLEGDTVRTPMAVPEESAHTGSAAQTAKQQAEAETVIQAEATDSDVGQASKEAAEPVSYWEEKPEIPANNASNDTNGGNMESTLKVAEAAAEAEEVSQQEVTPAPEASPDLVKPEPATTITDADDQGSVAVQANTALLVELPGNPTTGYTWSIENYNNSVLSLEDQNYVPSSNRVGSGGTFRFRFKSLAPGSTTIKLIYSRPWETNTSPAKTFSCQIDVQ